MQIVAGHLTEADVTAVAAWLGSQPVDPTARPLPQNSLRLPLRCGSEPQ
jgi:cytochrome c553